MPTSHGRRCRVCHYRISRRDRLCPVCRRLNLKPFDYVLISLGLSVLALLLLWRGL